MTEENKRPDDMDTDATNDSESINSEKELDEEISDTTDLYARTLVLQLLLQKLYQKMFGGNLEARTAFENYRAEFMNMIEEEKDKLNLNDHVDKRTQLMLKAAGEFAGDFFKQVMEPEKEKEVS